MLVCSSSNNANGRRATESPQDREHSFSPRPTCFMRVIYRLGQSYSDIHLRAKSVAPTRNKIWKVASLVGKKSKKKNVHAKQREHVQFSQKFVGEIVRSDEKSFKPCTRIC